ncbi:hypothetical protein FACS1894166_00390 [Bacilli bacterium]|nr:hypothetical protein FACS1894166_00390 [Bacilli bacterium]
MYDGEPGIPYNDLSSNMQIYKVVFYGNGNDASSSQQTLQFKVPEPGGGYGGISLTEASGWLSIHAPTDDDYHISDNDGFNGNKDDPYYS